MKCAPRRSGWSTTASASSARSSTAGSRSQRPSTATAMAIITGIALTRESLRPVRQLQPAPRNEPMRRLLDFAIGLLLLSIAAPLMGLIALAVRLYDRGPVFYRQERVGRYGAMFT